MKIAVLAWGSLIWDKRNLRIVGDWQKGGPVLPVEFSRISTDGRLTLVIDPVNGQPVVTRYAQCECENLNEAIANLKERENNPPKERIGFINLTSNSEREWSRQNHPDACDQIKAWAQAGGWQAVIWTALITNFQQKRKIPFSVINAADYITSLSGEEKTNSLEYIRQAPNEVVTPVRQMIVKNNLDWFNTH